MTRRGLGAIRATLAQAFGHQGRVDRWAIALYLLVNVVVLLNVVVYDPGAGYDGYHHERYVRPLSNGRLPEPRDTREFFSPPLPYALPALAKALGMPLLGAVKLGQVLNVAWSLGLTLVVLLLAEVLRPGEALLKRLSLPLLGLVAVYPRTFSFFRAEPLVAFLAALALLQALRLFGAEATRRQALALGTVLGLLMLARQQGIFVVAASGVFGLARAAAEPQRRRLHLSHLALAAAVTAVLGGWFYVSLWKRFGTPMAFNKPRSGLSLSNRPPSFFALGDSTLFTDPIRPSFKGQFAPVLYADAWGDYYGYFLLYAYDARGAGRFIPPSDWEGLLDRESRPPWLVTNRFSRSPYLGRVNALSLLPTGLALGGLLLGLGCVPRMAGREEGAVAGVRALALLALVVAVSLIGYVLALFTVPASEIPGSPQSMGTTIKASYVLQVFPLLALLAAEAGVRVRERSPAAFRVLVLALAAIALHNAPTLKTAHWPWPPDSLRQTSTGSAG